MPRQSDGRPSIMGVDAALGTTAIAVMRGIELLHWCQVETKGEDHAQRLLKIYDLAADAIRRCRPAACYVEKPGGWARGSDASRQQTVEVLAQARAAVMLACAAEGVTCHEAAVASIRSLIPRSLMPGRSGTPPKALVLRYLRLREIVVPEDGSGPLGDVADAMLCALYGQAKLVRSPARPKRRERAVRMAGL